jgi:2-dehydropantoate 2-reductase
MCIAVIGTGGIGGPYGASLTKAGADVIFVARGAHLAAICENGLRIEGDRGETHYPAGPGHRRYRQHRHR